MGKPKYDQPCLMTEAQAKEIAVLFETLSQKCKDLGDVFTEMSKNKGYVEKLDKPKVKKDPNAPRKPLSGYMLFSVDMREKVKTKHPDISQQDVSRELGLLWKKITPEDKKKYLDRAKVEAEKYKEEYAAYKKNTKDAQENSANTNNVKVEGTAEEEPGSGSEVSDSESEKSGGETDNSEKEETESESEAEPVTKSPSKPVSKSTLSNEKIKSAEKKEKGKRKKYKSSSDSSETEEEKPTPKKVSIKELGGSSEAKDIKHKHDQENQKKSSLKKKSKKGKQ